MFLKYPTTAWKPVNGGTEGVSPSRSWVVKMAGLFLQHYRIGAGIAYRDISKYTMGKNLAGSLWVTSDGCVLLKTSGQTGIL